MNDRVVKIIKGALTGPARAIAMESDLTVDLKVDDCDRCVIALAVEDACNVSFPDVEIYSWNTVADIVRSLDNRSKQ